MSKARQPNREIHATLPLRENPYRSLRFAMRPSPRSLSTTIAEFAIAFHGHFFSVLPRPAKLFVVISILRATRLLSVRLWYFPDVQGVRNNGMPPIDLSCRVLRSGDAEVALLSFTPKLPARLTEAERDVALAVARGSSNAQIGKDRHVSARTVANQVAAIMRKLRISSRAELAARFGARDFV